MAEFLGAHEVAFGLAVLLKTTFDANRTLLFGEVTALFQESLCLTPVQPRAGEGPDESELASPAKTRSEGQRVPGR